MHLLALLSLLIVPASANSECARDYTLSLRGKCTAVMWFGVADEPLWVERAMCSGSDKTIAVLLPKAFDGLEGANLAAVIKENSSLKDEEVKDVVEHVTWTGYPCTDDVSHLVIIEHFVGEGK